jgi:hypothetical protein
MIIDPMCKNCVITEKSCKLCPECTDELVQFKLGMPLLKPSSISYYQAEAAIAEHRRVIEAMCNTKKFKRDKRCNAL